MLVNSKKTHMKSNALQLGKNLNFNLKTVIAARVSPGCE